MPTIGRGNMRPMVWVWCWAGICWGRYGDRRPLRHLRPRLESNNRSQMCRLHPPLRRNCLCRSPVRPHPPVQTHPLVRSRRFRRQINQWRRHPRHHRPSLPHPPKLLRQHRTSSEKRGRRDRLPLIMCNLNPCVALISRSLNPLLNQLFKQSRNQSRNRLQNHLLNQFQQRHLWPHHQPRIRDCLRPTQRLQFAPRNHPDPAQNHPIPNHRSRIRMEQTVWV
jgi:hypothetical protein